MQFHWTQTHYWQHSLLLPPLTTENPEELYTTLWGKTIQSFFLKPDTRSLSSSSISFSHILFNPFIQILYFYLCNLELKNWSSEKLVQHHKSYLLLWTPMEDPRASNCSEIWKASSLVGVRTRANNRWGVSNSAWRIGKAKAPVFPEPVSASPMMSLPARRSKGAKNCYTSRTEKEDFKALCNKTQEFPKDRKKKADTQKAKNPQRAKPKNFRISLKHF